MFDATTTALIRSVPPMDGVDVTRLPELLTSCFTQISAVRLRLVDQPTESLAELVEAMSSLRRLAITLEVHAALTVDRDASDAAAFVSATAHRMLLQARRITGITEPTAASLTERSVPSEIAAGLLFLSSGYPADAQEAVANLVIDDASPVAPLLRAVRDFCNGNLRAINAYQIQIPGTMEAEDRALLTVWNRILGALKLLSVRFLSPGLRAQAVRAREELLAVRVLCTQDLPPAPGIPAHLRVVEILAGPFHLATLLMAASNGLEERALIDVEPPSGPTKEEWEAFLKERAKTRPFIWTNHKEAILSGLLDEGKSAAISFPTGAGKSTLSELKIAATVLAGRKVIYLAPTLALVGQVGRNLRALLSTASIEEDDVEDQLFVTPEVALEKAISVMTPERCLLLLTLFPESFAELGLVVFDECHFLHMTPSTPGSRPVTAMLSLLRLFELAKEADILLMSAMMRNGEEIAAWLEASTGREAFPFDAAWKPTRQARGSIVFEDAEISAATGRIPNAPNRIPQRDLKAVPYGVFCLQQTWASNSLDDYKVLQLTDQATPLQGKRSRMGRPFVALETSSCARAIAKSAAEQGIKSIVFFHTSQSILPSMREVATGLPGSYTPTPDEEALIDAATIELGGPEFVQLPNVISGGHYGDLLREERDVVESAFKRPDGIRILFSTNTLAQGMNLPADQVIIVRTGSYNADSDSYQNIAVHDLLNAAGRAGRAGLASNGIVLVIPDQIVRFNNRGQVSGFGLGRLKNDILAQDDRCLDIVDPIEVILDRIASAPAAESESVEALLLRLPSRTDDVEAAPRIRTFLGRSLAAFQASQNGESDAFAGRVERAIERRSEIIGSGRSVIIEALCGGTGLPPQVIESYIVGLDHLERPGTMTPMSWARWLVNLATQNPLVQKHLLSATSALTTLDVATAAVELWLQGAPYKDIELMLGTPPDKLGSLRLARKFVREMVREFSYAVGLAGQIAKAHRTDLSDEIIMGASKAAMLLRAGFDSIDMYVLFERQRWHHWTRVRTHIESHTWLRFVNAGPELESISEAFRRVGRGIQRHLDAADQLTD